MNLPDPFKYTCIVSDFKVARLLLEGDSTRNIRQAEKAVVYKEMNARPFSGLFTKKTYGEGWDVYRKAIAPRF